MSSEKTTNIIQDTGIILAYRSIKHGSFYFQDLLSDFMAVTANHIIFYDWINVRVKKYFGIINDNMNRFISNTLGLSLGFIASSMIFTEKYSIKNCIIEAGLVSGINYVIREFSVQQL